MDALPVTDATSVLANLLDEPLVVIDVGARWGFSRVWDRLGDRCHTIGFEPDAVECERLSQLSRGHRNVRFVPLALGSSSGLATLYMTREPGASSVFLMAADALERHPALECGYLEGTRMIETTTLDQWCSSEHVERVDVIKIDTQGSELDILKGAGAILATARAIEVEVEFNELYEGAPLFGDVDRFLRERGFKLWKFRDLAHYAQAGARTDWRVQEFCHYDAYRADVVSGAGQLYWANAFYLSTAVARPDPGAGWKTLVRDACVTSAHQFHDLASRALELAAADAPDEVQGLLREAVSEELRLAHRDRVRTEKARVISGTVMVGADDQAFHGGAWRDPEVQDFGFLRWTGPGRDAWIDVPVTLIAGSRIELLVAAAMTSTLLETLEVEVNRVPIELRRSPHPDGVLFVGLVPHGYRSDRRFSRIMVHTLRPVPWNELNPESAQDTELGVAVAWLRLSPPDSPVPGSATADQ